MLFLTLYALNKVRPIRTMADVSVNLL